MHVFAAVMTGKGTGAISTIQVFGDSAEIILQRIFKPAGTKPAVFKPGKILLGTITRDNETIDQVTIGCEGPGTIAINCHGNPLIVEMIMQLLSRHGAKLLTAEQMLCKTLAAQKPIDTIELEAQLAQPKAKTIEGAKIVVNQIKAGLSKKAAEWLNNIDTISLDRITAEAKQILETSRTAKLIIYGCTAVIAGPPNTGKSTLLNCLAGRQKAIVTDIKGTTRDWVSARCQISPLSVELIDTAGLDQALSTTIEKESQKRAVQILEKADLVLLVLDGSGKNKTRHGFTQIYTDILVILNKSDLGNELNEEQLNFDFAASVRISAKFGTNIEKLLQKIRAVLGVDDFDLKSAACITSRQEKLVKQLSKAKSKEGAVSIITELLNGRLSV